MDKKEIYEAADKCIENNYSKYDILDHSDIQQFFIFGAEWALSLPKEVEPNKEVDLEEFGGIENIVLLYLQENRYTFSGDSINGYPFVSEIDSEFKCNLQGVLEDFSDDLLNGLPHLNKPVESEWISVEEKPRINERIIVSGNDLVWSIMYHNEVGFNKHVTHWMPLPQPPKNNSNN